jgi:hypothetical protein
MINLGRIASGVGFGPEGVGIVSISVESDGIWIRGDRGFSFLVASS